MYLDHVSLTSSFGFALWSVQSASVYGRFSDIRAQTRSAIVIFGKANVKLEEGCRVEGSVHGVCGRGRAVFTASDSNFSACGQRAIYAYDKSCLTLERCLIEKTRSTTLPAVDFLCVEGGYLVMINCTIAENGSGLGLRIGLQSKNNYTLTECHILDKLLLMEFAAEDKEADEHDDESAEKDEGKSKESSCVWEYEWDVGAETPTSTLTPTPACEEKVLDLDMSTRVSVWKSFRPSFAVLLEASWSAKKVAPATTATASERGEEEDDRDEEFRWGDSSRFVREGIYVVDLCLFVQINTATHYERKIRRRENRAKVG